MPRLMLLRHAMTRGNLERRWVGTTDQPLCRSGIALARRCAFSPGEVPKKVWTSPLRRCRETASILFPGVAQIAVPDLRETDFGPFENKNHRELEGDPLYEAWIRSAGAAPVPGLESREEVAARAVPAFSAIAEELAETGEDGGIVTHGGVIMEICAALARPERDCSRWWVPCCGGWLIDLAGWRGTGRFSVIREILPPGEDGL